MVPGYSAHGKRDAPILRLLKLLGLIGIMAWLAFVGTLLISHLTMSPGVNPENFRRLRVGMAQTEVERIFGRPGEFEPKSPHWQQWNENGTFISVGFGNHDGTLNCASANVSVSGSGRYLLEIPEESIITNIRRWLGF